MNEEKESLYKIKVNKTIIKRKRENYIKSIKSQFNKNNESLEEDKILKKNSSSIKINNISNFDIKEKKNLYINYSQRTFRPQKLFEINSYRKGNIIYDIQKNKYLKPILDSKDIKQKILNCKISQPFYKIFYLKKNNINREIIDKKSISIDNNIIKNKINKDTFNKFLRNKINEGNNSFNNKINEYINNDIYINKSQNKSCRTYKYNCNNKINYKIDNIFKNDKGMNIFNLKYIKNYKNLLIEKIGYFCYFLEIFFLNIIKKNFKNFINKLNKEKENNIFKINSENNSRKNTFYDTFTIKSIKNDLTIKTNTFSNFNNLTGCFDRDIIENYKEKKYFKNKFNNSNIKINNSNNEKYKTIENNNNKKIHKKRLIILRKKNKNNKFNNLLIYKKKISISKNDISNQRESENNKKEYNFSFTNRDYLYESIDKNKIRHINLKNYLENSKDYYKINSKKNLFIFMKNYIIKDSNYKKIYFNKYKNKLKIYYDYLCIHRNINFSIIKKNNLNIYKKTKIYKSKSKFEINNTKNNNIITDSLKNNHLKSLKKKYNIKMFNSDKKDKLNNSKTLNNFNTQNIRYFLTDNKTEGKIRENYSFYSKNNENINKVVINCVKLLIKVIKKLYIKKNYNSFRKYLEK